MAKTKEKPAGKQKIQAGPKGKMHKFAGAGAQAPGGSAVTEHKGKGAAFAKGGPSGKMHKFAGVGTQKPGVSAVTPGGSGNKYAK